MTDNHKGTNMDMDIKIYKKKGDIIKYKKQAIENTLENIAKKETLKNSE